MGNKEKIFFENLDGLRFLAFLSVFLFHSFYTSFDYIKQDQLYVFFYHATRMGWLGVNFFFVLSGFLITFLILKEEHLNGRIKLGWFYTRRILRIWPLYYLVVGFCFIVYLQVAQHFTAVDVSETNFWLFFFHLRNYNYIYSPSDIPTLNILWSISIEEQFYLVWPIILVLFKDKSRYRLFVGLLLFSLVFSWWFRDDFHYYHHHIFSCMFDLITGAFAAWMVLKNKELLEKITNQPRSLIILVYFIGLLYLILLSIKLFDNNILFTPLFFGYVILEQNYAINSIFKISNFPMLSFLGRYTYGLYCYHYLALLMAIKISQHFNFNQHIFGVLVFENVLGLIITVVVAIVSYHVYELPFLKMKKSFTFFVK